MAADDADSPYRLLQSRSILVLKIQSIIESVSHHAAIGMKMFFSGLLLPYYISIHFEKIRNHANLALKIAKGNLFIEV